SDSEISLSLDSKSKYFCLIVSDQGKGIARRDLPGIFEKFHKGSDHTKEGIGLGLFLAKIITGEHRGKIEIESEVNKGTEVRVLLPKIGNKKN
ncbi:MAG: ATP-binding protein, partial [Candidatus Daviesbacteria bacterium]|nr:ATP-binding protein [Candidatus Daviesbacteria bacterium]